MLAVSLSRAACIGPQQTAIAKVRVDDKLVSEVSDLTGIVVPKEKVLAENQCDFAEGIYLA